MRKIFQSDRIIINGKTITTAATCTQEESYRTEAIDLKGNGVVTYNPIGVDGELTVEFNGNDESVDTIQRYFTESTKITLQAWRGQVFEEFRGIIFSMTIPCSDPVAAFTLTYTRDLAGHV